MLAIFAAWAVSAAAAEPFYANTFEKAPTAEAMSQLGRALFFDGSLSRSGKMSCATCHDPNHAFAPGDARRLTVRAVPSLMYTQNVPPFTEHYFDDDGDDSLDQGPAGGRTWDGRSESAHEQARLPLFSPLEMGNGTAEDVVRKVQSSAYALAFRHAFGEKIFDQPAMAFKAILMALETFEQSPREFYPYTSKYDAWLRGEAQLSPDEAEGLAVFNDRTKGNCARCHPSGKKNGAFPQFTDFGYAAIGAPRNPAIAANSDPHYFDLGLCGPLRTDLLDRKEYCGLFRTPSLRNVATRRVFLHNGVFRRLDDVVRFYAERDTQPQKWYPSGPRGVPQKFDDLPALFWANVDTQTPLDRHAGDRPALGEADIKHVIAFLRALTDGYDANHDGDFESCGLKARKPPPVP